MTKRKFTPPTEFPADGYVTSNGHKVVLVLIMPDGRLLGYWIDGRGACHGGYWELDGTHSYNSGMHLHDAPKTVSMWGNVHKGACFTNWHDSREKADEVASYNLCPRVAVIRLDETDGEYAVTLEDL